MLNSKNCFVVTILSNDDSLIEGFRATASIPVELDDGVLDMVLKKVEVWKDHDNVVTSIDVSLSHCISFCDETSVHDVDVVVKLTEEKKVVAMLLIGKLTLILTFPMFVIRKEHMEFCKRYPKIVMQWIPPETGSISSATKQSINDLSMLSEDIKVQVNSNVKKDSSKPDKDTSPMDYVVTIPNKESVVTGGIKNTYCFTILLGTTGILEFTAVSEIPMKVDKCGILETDLTVLRTDLSVIDEGSNSKTNGVFRLSRFSKTDIVVYDGTLKKDIDVVVEHVARKQAAAIFLLQRPS